MSKLKIVGGTPNHGEPSLCLTCRNATVVQGHAIGQRIVQCGALCGPHDRISFHVAECSDYDDKRHPTKREMEEMAWLLLTKKAGRQIGFVRAADYKRNKRDYVENVEDDD